MIGVVIFSPLSSFKDLLINKKAHAWLFAIRNIKIAHSKLLIKDLKC
jgi:hypothetical protein